MLNTPDYASNQPEEPTAYNTVRCGVVVDRRITNAGSENLVYYPDRGVVSDWLPCSRQGTVGNVFHLPPYQVGEIVTTAHFSTGIERGVILGSHHVPNNPSLVPASLDSVHLLFNDGASINYDPVTGSLSTVGVNTVYLQAQGEIQVSTNGQVNLNAGGNVSVLTGGDLDATVGGNLNATVTGNIEASCTDMDATCSGEATITAPTITLKGNVLVTGNLTVDGVSALQGGGSATPHLTNTDGSGGGS